jgi:hypothetical protein
MDRGGGAAGSATPSRWASSRATADAPDRPVIQLHGTLADDETLVFTRAQ